MIVSSLRFIYVCLLISLAAGCSFLTAPADLLTAPKVATNLQNLRESVTTLLPDGAKLTIPTQSKWIGSIQEIDVYGDEANEAIVFYKQEELLHVGVLVLEKIEENWTLVHQIEQVGFELERAIFQDITGDGQKEMLIGWGGGTEVSYGFSAYTFDNSDVRDIGSLTYTDIVIADLDGDNVDDLLSFQLDSETSSGFASYYRFSSETEELELVNEVELYGDVTGYSQMIVGKASFDKTGVFLELTAGDVAHYTALLLAMDGQLQDVFATSEQSEEENIRYKPIPTMSMDVNEDGIIEMDTLVIPSNTDDVSLNERELIHRWMQWDGDNKLVRVQESVIDSKAGYRFDFPTFWWDNITLIKEGEQDIVIQYFNPSTQEQAELLKLQAYSLTNWRAEKENLQQNQQTFVELGSRRDTMVIAIMASIPYDLSPPALAEYKNMMLDEETIKKSFHWTN
ncbi:FG-GAP repeat domain-containing protein [Longirhabdus pacifica]|uniref:FG-GAP repeat domain-containing protein n=1 Tax=Longirhabdus pacifica TaxID=2305227 RepID=UPI00100901B0|nr:VCBS repeat-containing protein [Longirhabdus pacifica]